MAESADLLLLRRFRHDSKTLAAAGRTRSEAMATPDGEEEVPAGEQARENDEPMEERLSNKSKSACELWRSGAAAVGHDWTFGKERVLGNAIKKSVLGGREHQTTAEFGGRLESVQ